MYSKCSVCTIQGACYSAIEGNEIGLAPAVLENLVLVLTFLSLKYLQIGCLIIFFQKFSGDLSIPFSSNEF